MPGPLDRLNQMGNLVQQAQAQPKQQPPAQAQMCPTCGKPQGDQMQTLDAAHISPEDFARLQQMVQSMDRTGNSYRK